MDQEGPDAGHFISDETPEKCFRTWLVPGKFTGKSDVIFSGPKLSCALRNMPNSFRELYGTVFVPEKFLVLKSKHGNFDSIMALSGEAVTDLKWWINSVEETSKPGKQRETQITMTTDASKKGWGALWRVLLPGAHGHTMKPNIT